MGAYDDIINLPHPTSVRHPRMAMIDRAAQFSPFAALSGHGTAIQETARLMEQKIELTEDEKAIRDEKLRLLVGSGGEAVFTYFLPDEKKSGGAYVAATGSLKKINRLEQNVILTDGTAIPIGDILEIEKSKIKYIGSKIDIVGYVLCRKIRYIITLKNIFAALTVSVYCPFRLTVIL